EAQGELGTGADQVPRRFRAGLHHREVEAGREPAGPADQQGGGRVGFGLVQRPVQRGDGGRREDVGLAVVEVDAQDTRLVERRGDGGRRGRGLAHGRERTGRRGGAWTGDGRTAWYNLPARDVQGGLDRETGGAAGAEVGRGRRAGRAGRAGRGCGRPGGGRRAPRPARRRRS